MASVVEGTAVHQAITAVDEAIQQIGVLSITTMGRYTVLQNAVKGFGNLDDARYNFALEANLLADAHKQWKLAADELERTIALGPSLLLNPETGEHDEVPYQLADGTPIHPGCACSEQGPFGNGTTPFDSLPFPEASGADHWEGYPDMLVSERPWRPE